MAEWGGVILAPPEAGVSAKCDIYSGWVETPHHFSLWDKAHLWGTGPKGPVTSQTTGQETRLSQRRTAACGTEGLTTHPMDTRDQDYNSKNTSRAAVLPACVQTPHERGGQSFRGSARRPWKLVVIIESSDTQIHTFSCFTFVPTHHFISVTFPIF